MSCTNRLLGVVLSPYRVLLLSLRSSCPSFTFVVLIMFDIALICHYMVDTVLSYEVHA